ncbi:MAG: hypothetical protein KGL15_03815 [Acidobacteriota bacterium]|nr:hypothetical protein [Acidobacteriota bacterium]
MTEEQTVAAASDLAERIVDEVSRAKHDWPLVARLAGALADLARQAAASASRRPRAAGH